VWCGEFSCLLRACWPSRMGHRATVCRVPWSRRQHTLTHKMYMYMAIHFDWRTYRDIGIWYGLTLDYRGRAGSDLEKSGKHSSYDGVTCLLSSLRRFPDTFSSIYCIGTQGVRPTCPISWVIQWICMIMRWAISSFSLKKYEDEATNSYTGEYCIIPPQTPRIRHSLWIRHAYT